MAFRPQSAAEIVVGRVPPGALELCGCAWRMAAPFHEPDVCPRWSPTVSGRVLEGQKRTTSVCAAGPQHSSASVRTCLAEKYALLAGARLRRRVRRVACRVSPVACRVRRLLPDVRPRVRRLLPACAPGAKQMLPYLSDRLYGELRPVSSGSRFPPRRISPDHYKFPGTPGTGCRGRRYGLPGPPGTGCRGRPVPA